MCGILNDKCFEITEYLFLSGQSLQEEAVCTADDLEGQIQEVIPCQWCCILTADIRRVSRFYLQPRDTFHNILGIIILVRAADVHFGKTPLFGLFLLGKTPECGTWSMAVIMEHGCEVLLGTDRVTT